MVRIAAADSMLHLVDDTGFYADVFTPYLEECFGGLFGLLNACVEVDTKLRVLNVISIVMAGMGTKIRPIVAGVVRFVCVRVCVDVCIYIRMYVCVCERERWREWGLRLSRLWRE